MFQSTKMSYYAKETAIPRPVWNVEDKALLTHITKVQQTRYVIAIYFLMGPQATWCY